MSSHTPGPWHVDIEENWPADAPCFITAGSGGPLCIVDNREDAHLIAAAPEMLDALCKIYSLSCGEDDDEDTEVMLVARAAIAKARGEE